MNEKLVWFTDWLPVILCCMMMALPFVYLCAKLGTAGYLRARSRSFIEPKKGKSNGYDETEA